MNRQDVLDIIAEVFRFGEIKSSKLDGSKNVVVCLKTTDDDSSAPDSEMFGQGPLQYKPVDGTDALFLHLGDERTCLSVKHRDWQLSIGNGEVVLQALGGTTPAYLHLKPNGDATLKGANLTVEASADVVAKGANVTLDPTTLTRLAGSSSNQPFINGTAWYTYFDLIFAAISTAIGGVPVAGTGLKTTLDAAKVTIDGSNKAATLSTIVRGR